MCSVIGVAKSEYKKGMHTILVQIPIDLVHKVSVQNKISNKYLLAGLSDSEA